MSIHLSEYESIIGLEVHAQLSTETKMFCSCRAAYGGEPNSRVCPVCLGLPGALPVANRVAVDHAVRMGLATHCTVAPRSFFARKNYFYPDCPKNYQISQFEEPICSGGHVTIASGKRIGITRIHLEEDAGKLTHNAAGESLLDLNRCGVPLIEIVSEPDIRTPAEARSYVRELREILRYLDVCDGNMEKGNLRCDANVSIRKRGSAGFGVKTEIKNVNSFKFIEQALTYEIERQRRSLEGGGEVEHVTLLWDAENAEARVMRSKEASHDYRYFPEPDLPTVRVSPSRIRAIEKSLPELPGAKRQRFHSQYGISAHDASVLTASRELADYFESVAGASGSAKGASNWVMGDVLRELKERSLEITEFGVPAGELAGLIRLVESGRVNMRTAREIFRSMMETGASAEDIVAREGLEQITDEDEIAAVARQVIEANPDAVEKYLRGKDTLLKYFVGQLMKATGGKANPQQAETILKSLLEDFSS